MRIVFIGSVIFSAQLLRELIDMKADIVGVCTLSVSNFNADHEDLSPIAKKAGIPVHCEVDINSPASINWISSLRPDVIFCFGWSRLISESLLSLPPMGVIGFHPASLPANRGRHPIIWALVLGLDETSSTFFRLDNGVDSGQIISQVKIPITPSDNALTLYERITQSALIQLRHFVPLLAQGRIQLLPQDDRLANNWRKRGSADGRIDWRMAASSIHDLVRGLTRPYVGAHFDYDDKIIKVWQTEVELVAPVNFEPGKVLHVGKNSLLVKAGIGAIRLLDYAPIIKVAPGSYL